MKILLRLSSDLTTKSDKVRARFVARLLRNLQAGFKAGGIRATIERQWSRLFVVTDDARALDVLSRVFGLSSFSPVERECTADFAELLRLGVETFAPMVAGKSFAVRVKRTGTHPYKSQDLAGNLGALLRPHAAKVDLKSPDVEAQIEVRGDVAYLYSRHMKGAGGLPLGVSGRAMCLLSGGFDSAVAAWLMMKRGVEVDFIFCNMAGEAYEKSVIEIARFMQDAWGMGGRAHLNVVDFEPLGRAIAGAVRPAYAQVVLKRQFYRAAARLAERHKALAIITGECVGQVASQTLLNLRAIETADDLLLAPPLLRPVIGLDKEEIIALARRIGSNDLSAAVKEYCQLVEQKPVTAATKDKLDREDRKLVSRWLDEAFAARRVHHLAEPAPVPATAGTDVASYFVDRVPDGAVVIDCREEHHYEAWHWPGAINIELPALLDQFRRLLGKERTYVIYCPVGLQSAVAAEAMQRAGWSAFGMRGGVRALQPDTNHPSA